MPGAPVGRSSSETATLAVAKSAGALRSVTSGRSRPTDPGSSVTRSVISLALDLACAVARSVRKRETSGVVASPHDRVWRIGRDRSRSHPRGCFPSDPDQYLLALRCPETRSQELQTQPQVLVSPCRRHRGSSCSLGGGSSCERQTPKAQAACTPTTGSRF